MTAEPPFRVGAFLTLHKPSGTEFDVVLQEVNVTGGGEAGAPLDVRVVFETGWATFDREFEILHLFHSDEEYRGEGPPGGLIEGKQVVVEIRLDDALASEHFAGMMEAEVAARLMELEANDPTHVLLETESWFLIAATQEAPLPTDAPPGASLREGFRTIWADAETVSR